ncbi:MAG: hypothetical protein R2761_24315 [Acidimicrobiales bacterium]
MPYSLIRGGAAGALALSLVLAACGSSGDDTDTTGASTAVSEAGSSATTEAGASATTEGDAAATTEAAAAAADGQAVELKEWSVTVTGDVTSGANTFAIANTGENPHALAIVKGDSYESLPKLDNGAVDEANLEAGAFIGQSERVAQGSTGTLSVTLEPGNYVFFCPIAFGPNSHAKAGQVLPVTVS